MHYSNGRAAKVGDLVRGKGYNFKHEVIGIVIEAKPGVETCNVSVATIGIRKDVPVQMSASVAFGEDGKLKAFDVLPKVEVSTEYGQLDAFVALDPLTGEVLAAEVEAPAEPAASPA